MVGQGAIGTHLGARCRFLQAATILGWAQCTTNPLGHGNGNSYNGSKKRVLRSGRDAAERVGLRQKGIQERFGRMCSASVGR